MRLLTAAVTFLTAVLALPTNSEYYGHKVIRFSVENKQQQVLLEELIENENLGLDVWKRFPEGVIDINVSPSALKQIHAAIPGLKSEVFIEDLQKLLDQEKIDNLENANVDIFSAYQSQEAYMTHLLSLRTSSEFSIGLTYEGREIRGVKMGMGPKEVVINGGIHAREWISPAIVTYFADFLGSEDPRAIDLMESFTFHIIPVLNADGYEFSRTKNRMWRKNREPNQGSICIGTDINRNFKAAWSKSGASGSACSDSYYGSGPLSTREAKALDEYVGSLSNVVSYYDFHSYSQLWLYPYGYTCNEQSPDEKDLYSVSKAATDKLKSFYGTNYKFGSACKTIYQASGTTIDHFYLERGIKYAVTPELRDTGLYGFALPAAQIKPTGIETTEALITFFNAIK